MAKRSKSLARTVGTAPKLPKRAVGEPEVAALRRELSEALERQKATSDILDAINSSSIELQPILDMIVRTASRLCNAEFALIYRLRDGKYHLAATNNTASGFVKYASEHPLSPGRGSLIVRVALEQQVVHLPDCLADPEYKALEYQRAGKYRTSLGIPLQQDGAPVGVIALMRAVVKPFTDKQIELVSTFADQAVIAIQNARLFDELTESMQQQTATADVLKIISRSAFDIQAVLKTLVESAARLCEAENVQIFLRDGEVYRLTAHNGFSPEYQQYVEQHPISVGRGTLVARTALEVAPVHIPDVLLDPEYTWREGQKLAGFRALLGVPLLREGRCVGVMAMTRTTPRPFTVRQTQLVTTFADQAVIAIENVRLFDEVRVRTDDLRESLQQQTATADVLKVISRSTFDLQPVLETLVESAARLCDADKAFIFQRDDELYRLAVNYGFSKEFEEYARQNPMAPARGTITGRAALEGRTVHIPDVLADPEYDGMGYQALGQYRSALGVPLQRDGETIGIFTLTRSEVRPFSDKQIELVTTFADQAVIAIENVRLFDEVQARTRDLTESLEQQTATSEVLQVISSSPGELEPVFEKMMENATRVCGAKFGTMTLLEEGTVRQAALYNVPPAYAEALGTRTFRPHPERGLGQVIRTKQVAHIADVQTNPAYLEGNPAIVALSDLGGARTLVSVPMLRD